MYKNLIDLIDLELTRSSLHPKFAGFISADLHGFFRTYGEIPRRDSEPSIACRRFKEPYMIWILEQNFLEFSCPVIP